jgi:hypothetical protein
MPTDHIAGEILPIGFGARGRARLLPTGAKSGATGSHLRRPAIDLALAFFVPVYGYFCLKIIELIREISAMIS